MFGETVVLLYEVEGPFNLGAVCRAMANTGFLDLRYSGRLAGNESGAYRFAVHAGQILSNAQKHDNLDGLIADRDVVYGFSPRNPWDDGNGLDLDGFLSHYKQEASAGRRIGLLFGNEKRGLENAQLARCTRRVALPTSKVYVSMNLAQAALVVLWELHRNFGIAPAEERVEQAPVAPVEATVSPQDAAGAEQVGVMLDNLHRFMETIHFLNPQNPQHVWEEFQTLFQSRRWRERELTLLNALFGKARARYLAEVKKSQADDPSDV